MFNTHRFVFDRVFDQNSTQAEVYNTAARPAVMSCLEGYNAALIAYGQTGTGKTYTMEGETMRGEHRGIIPRTIEDIFSYIQNDGESVRSKFLVRASYLQVSAQPHGPGAQVNDHELVEAVPAALLRVRSATRPHGALIRERPTTDGYAPASTARRTPPRPQLARRSTTR